MEQVVEILTKIYDVLVEIHEVLLDFDSAYLEDCEDEEEGEEEAA